MPRPSQWPNVVERVGKERIIDWRRQGHGSMRIALEIMLLTGEYMVSGETVRRHMAEIDEWTNQ